MGAAPTRTAATAWAARGALTGHYPLLHPARWLFICHANFLFFAQRAGRARERGGVNALPHRSSAAAAAAAGPARPGAAVNRPAGVARLCEAFGNEGTMLRMACNTAQIIAPRPFPLLPGRCLRRRARSEGRHTFRKCLERSTACCKFACPVPY